MIHDDGEYLRDPRPKATGGLVRPGPVHLIGETGCAMYADPADHVRAMATQPATIAASATAGSGERDGKGEGDSRTLTRDEAVEAAFGVIYGEMPGIDAAAAYDAMEPIIRRAVAEVIARRIEALEDLDYEDAGEVVRRDDAAAIAREVGRG